MKSKLIPLTIIAILFVGGIIALLTPQERQEATQQVSSGILDYYPDFPSKYIQARDVNVWLPNGYKKGDECQVLYMHDGQMLFDATTTWNKQEWRVDEVMGELLASNSVPNTIVVAVDNTENKGQRALNGKVFVGKRNECLLLGACCLGRCRGAKALLYLGSQRAAFKTKGSRRT